MLRAGFGSKCRESRHAPRALANHFTELLRCDVCRSIHFVRGYLGARPADLSPWQVPQLVECKSRLERLFAFGCQERRPGDVIRVDIRAGRSAGRRQNRPTPAPPVKTREDHGLAIRAKGTELAVAVQCLGLIECPLVMLPVCDW
jgi:hypothetical protein